MGNYYSTQIPNEPFVCDETLCGTNRFENRYREIWVAYREARWRRVQISEKRNFWNPLESVIVFLGAISAMMLIKPKTRPMQMIVRSAITLFGLGWQYFFYMEREKLAAQFTSNQHYLTDLSTIVGHFSNCNARYNRVTVDEDQLLRAVNESDHQWGIHRNTQMQERIYAPLSFRNTFVSVFDECLAQNNDLVEIMNDEQP